MSKTPASDNPEHYRSAVYSGVRFVAQGVMLKSFVWSICKVSVEGREFLDNVEEPFIVISNHSSHLDASLILGALPRRLSKHVATGAAADYFFDKKLKGMATSMFFNAYPIERQGSRNHKGITGRLLDAGVPLLIFPEGTRSRTGAMGPFKPGVAALSISRSVPIIPMALVGAFAAWPYNRSLPPTDRPEVRVVIGHPMTALAHETASDFNERLRKAVAQLYNATAKAYGTPTLDDYARTVAVKQAEEAEEAARREEEDAAALAEAAELAERAAQADPDSPIETIQCEVPPQDESEVRTEALSGETGDGDAKPVRRRPRLILRNQR